MKLVLLCLLQAALSVGGTGLLTISLHGRALTPSALTASLTTWQGIVGLVLMFASFLVMGAILSFAKLSSYIPVTTGLTFLCTLVWTWFVDREAANVPTIAGMALIMAGVATIALSR